MFSAMVSKPALARARAARARVRVRAPAAAGARERAGEQEGRDREDEAERDAPPVLVADRRHLGVDGIAVRPAEEAGERVRGEVHERVDVQRVAHEHHVDVAQALRRAALDQGRDPQHGGQQEHPERPDPEPDEVRDRHEQPEEDGQPAAVQIVVVEDPQLVGRRAAPGGGTAGTASRARCSGGPQRRSCTTICSVRALVAPDKFKGTLLRGAGRGGRRTGSRAGRAAPSGPLPGGRRRGRDARRPAHRAGRLDGRRGRLRPARPAGARGVRADRGRGDGDRRGGGGERARAARLRPPRSRPRRTGPES